MPYCPNCHGEYRESIVSCAHCLVPLVPELPKAKTRSSAELRQAVAEQRALVISRAPYADANRMLETLYGGGVDAMLLADPGSCGAASGGCATHYMVAILEEDREEAARVLHEDWSALLDAEGAAAPRGELDLDAEGAHQCPACGERFEGALEECPECGLFLGAS